MPSAPENRPEVHSVSFLVRRKIERAGEQIWCMENFRDLPFTAVARTLSRLARSGVIRRLSKGIYYHGRGAALDDSKPDPTALLRLASRKKPVFPSGLAAANLLGFTSQTPVKLEIATCATSLPRKLIGQDTVVHTRRPKAWAKLWRTDAAFLDFLRRGGRTSDLSPEETVRLSLRLLVQGSRFERLAKVWATEPPRVRALLGALCELRERDPETLRRMRNSLNFETQFDFGMFAGLPNAKAWKAKQLH
ncbi:MAG TPA: hypothetical protein VK914_03240 [bacterium]|jgi:hypothetical protein|nr:hypothetical protein [bacterium]